MLPIKNNIAELDVEELRAKWYERCIGLLARREHSYVEMVQKLVQKGCGFTMAEEITQVCLDRGYLSVERFAYVYAHNQARLGYGPIKVRYLLRQHEVPEEIIAAVIAEIEWHEASAIALRKIGAQPEPKLSQALYRRGFIARE